MPGLIPYKSVVGRMIDDYEEKETRRKEKRRKKKLR